MTLAASVIIRTYNEERWLGRLLDELSKQDFPKNEFEIVIVDSGSTDDTLKIASRYACQIVKIKKSEFTFGRSLNIGCAAATGRNLVFISGHCIPTDALWLMHIIAPLGLEQAHYTYGRQCPYEHTKFSERQIFAKYFPASRETMQGGFFCNNANAALRRDIWAEHRFDENLTGLEDMELGKRLLQAGYVVDYVPEACVFHIHEENWKSVRLRYQREAIALQKVMPEVHLHLSDFLRYFVGAVLHDAGEALQKKMFLREASGIIMFRLMQYWGAYRGNNDHRVMSRQIKERYFYPK
jgi:glycosyltransferase involved in cell wall biosynthesis